MFKRVTLIVVMLVLTVLSALVIDGVQRAQDERTLAKIVQDNVLLQTLKNDEAIKERVICEPRDSSATHCPALLFKVSKEKCIELQNTLGINKEWCGHSIRLSGVGRDVEINFGQVYERPDGNLYVAVVMNERNLLSF